MKSRLRPIGPEEHRDHLYLDETDRCFYFGEYSPAYGVRTPTNDLILDLKKPVGRRSCPDWVYKVWAIEECVRLLQPALEEASLRGAMLVAAPSSKRLDHPAYDNRMSQVVGRLATATGYEWREMLVTTKSRLQRRVVSARMSPEQLAQTIAIDPKFEGAAPSRIIVVDDIVTTGATFKACKLVLQAAFPGVQVMGWFIARRLRRPPSLTPENGAVKTRDLAITDGGAIRAP